MKVNFTLPGLPVLLAIIFMILKLCNAITWSWFWVFSPIIISCVLGIGLLLLVLLITSLLYFIKVLACK
jgi:hypothetical protein